MTSEQPLEPRQHKLKEQSHLAMIWPLQVLRFAAALMVVYLHSAQTARNLAGDGAVPYQFVLLGSAGVDIFFVISGVIMATVAPGRSPAEFARARIFRIMPIYLLCSIPALAISTLSGSLGWRKLLATVFLWPATDRMVAPALGAAWSLCFEMVFYAAVTLVLVDRRLLYLLAAGFAGSFMLRSNGPVFQFLGNPMIMEFLAGVAMVRVGKIAGGLIMLPLGILALVGAAFIGAIPEGTDELFLTGEHNIYRIVVFGVPAILIVYGSMHLHAGKSVWTYLGDMSYSLYLVHPIVLFTLSMVWLMHPINTDVITVIGIIASLLASWWVFERIERPMTASLKQKRSAAATSSTLTSA